jgi:hypothetical protein
MTTEEFYARALLAAFRSQETNNVRNHPEQVGAVSLANEFAILLTEKFKEQRDQIKG